MNAYKSKRSEFIAIYGRRRIGKTYLVRETFANKLTFSYSGMANVSTKMQLFNFQTVLKQHGAQVDKAPTNWIEAFYQLANFLELHPAKKKVIFLDELPWMDGPKSSFLPAFENFWNAWASMRKDIVLIICGSATSWIVKKIFRNKGGLHNRLTDQIHLLPFTLNECEQYANAMKLGLSRKLILEGYMVLGGVPYYWSMLKKGLSMAENINSLFFARDAKLKNEFNDLYASLFKNPEPYKAIILALGNKKIGMTREDIKEHAPSANNGKLKDYLDDLENCGFIRRYNSIGSKNKNAMFQLVDNFTLFHFKFIADKKGTDDRYWQKIQGSPIYHTWCGLAFERVCLLHSRNIKVALGIDGILTTEYSWFSNRQQQNGAQIDLLIDRLDQAINLIECKYVKGKFSIDSKYANNLQNKIDTFRNVTNTRKSLFITLITAEGIVENNYSKEIDNSITADALFS